MLELNVSEILDEPRKVKPPGESLPFRYIPLEVIKTAKDCVNKENFSGCAEYILNAFYVFRRTVNRGLFAPHYANEGAYEWPPPAKFSWGESKIVHAVGEFIEGEIPRKSKKAIIESRDGGRINKKTIDPLTGFMRERFREFVSGKDDFEMVFKYRIEDISKVEGLFSNEWQNQSLGKYVCPLYRFVVECTDGRIDNDKGAEMMVNFLNNIEKDKLRF